MTDKSMAKEILPNTIGSREFIKAITQFSDVWLTQTKNVEAKKRKDAAKQKRKAISGKKVPASENVSSSTSEPDPGPWNPESKTTIGRVSYKIKEFPALMVAKLEFVYLESGSISSGNDVWQTLYPRKYRTEALSELLNNDFKEFKNVVAVNEAVGAKDLEDHLIVPAHSLRSEWLLKLQPRNIDLTESKQYVNDNTTQAIRCKITGLHGYTSRDLNTGPYQRSLLCLLHERITSVAGAGTTYEYLKDVSGPMAGTTKYRSIPRLISGWEMLLPPSPKLSAAHSLIGSAPVLDITLRGKMSIDRKRKLLNIDVDLAAIVGRSERVSNLIVDIFGNNITAHNVQRLKPTIADILVGLTVHRAYEATTTTTEKSQQTWYDPFQVREVLFNEEVMKRSGKSNFDTLAYFKNSAYSRPHACSDC